MNNQVESSLRVLLATIGPSIAALLIGLGVAESVAGVVVTAAIGIVPPLAAAIWGIVQNSDRNVIAAASKVEGVTKIKIDPAPGAASPGALAAADDDNLPNVKAQ